VADDQQYDSGRDFLSAFWETKHALALAWMAAFSQHGVHEGQQFILRCLWEQDGQSPGEVAKRLGLATPTVTKATTRMEAAGLLRRAPHPTDRRLVRLVLTDRGHELEALIGAEMERLEDRALAGFSARQRADLVRTLDVVQENLTGSATASESGPAQESGPAADSGPAAESDLASEAGPARESGPVVASGSAPVPMAEPGVSR
jgi:MarR family transcriptional regulator, organic hydroperoxide resistance regulator